MLNLLKNPFQNPTEIDDGPHPAPSLWLMALEVRAFWEFGAVLPLWPVLQRAPKGDGHAVLIFPGLSANDASTVPLRHYLASLGYAVHGWNQGYNFGPRAGVLAAARGQVRELFETTGRKVSLLGWSLGGVYARELAKEMPDKVRLVLTLGSPVTGGPRSTNAWRVFEMTHGRKAEDVADAFVLDTPPPVPSTSVYSRSDGIVAWQCSIQAKDARNPAMENVEVIASHVGIGLNPSAWWVVADRLAQPEGQWKPFERASALAGLVYPRPASRRAAAAAKG